MLRMERKELDKSLSKKFAEVVELCYEISTTTKCDVFFSYSPHCDAYCVSYFLRGWRFSGSERIQVDQVSTITLENLGQTLTILRKLQEDLKNGN